jgi:hypothetical protein
MKKLLLAFVAVLSLGTSGLVLADSCAVNARVCLLPAPRVVVFAPARHPDYRWIAWHRVHRFHRDF